MSNKCKDVKNTNNQVLDGGVPYRIERGIGHSSQKSLTKAELMSLIDKNFPEGQHASIAVLTTVSYGDYNNPSIMQSITLGKVLED